MANKLHNPPRSCKDCGARAISFAGLVATYRCGSKFVVEDENTGYWETAEHSQAISDPMVDDLSFKLNLNIHAAASEEQAIQITEEWAENRGILLEGWAHKRRCVAMHSQGTIQWEIRFYGTFGKPYPNRINLIKDLGLYLAKYYDQDGFRYTDHRRTYKVPIKLPA